ncbi:MAG: iron-sulfur cluster assembly scaffold protein [Planctomycetota bacterium]
MEWAYSDIVRDHFANPRNVLKADDDFEPDGKGIAGNIKCGDQMMMAITIDAEKGVITDCRWQTYGCASAIASTSILSEAVKGMTLDEAFQIDPKQIAARLGGLPENKIHCSVLGDKALRAAINDYYERTGQTDKVQRDESRLVCQCMNVTDHDIEDAVLEGARTYDQLQEHTKVGTVCGQCEDEARKLLETYIHIHFD